MQAETFIKASKSTAYYISMKSRLQPSKGANCACELVEFFTIFD
jgi:hypothetical protein